jgi:hypothetical protein
MLIQVTPATPTLINNAKPENVLDSLLDELQVFASGAKSDSPSTERPSGAGSGRRSLDLGKKSAPQPPPRSSSSKINEQQDQLRQLMLLQTSLSNVKSNSSDRPPPTLPKPNVIRSNSVPCGQNSVNNATTNGTTENIAFNDTSTSECNGSSLKVQMALSISNTSLSSIDSQESVINGSTAQHKSRQQRLEERHQELLRKQRLLQEQYSQLQQLVRGEMPKSLVNEAETALNGKQCDTDLTTNGGAGNSVEGASNELIANGHSTSPDNSHKHNSNTTIINNVSVNQHGDGTVKGTAAQKVYRTDIL